MKKGMIVAAIAIMFVAGAAQAGVITPVGVVDGGGAYNPAGLLIDGSGLTAVGDVTLWTCDSGGGDGNSWKGPAGSGLGPLTFDLGASYDLTLAYVWNYTHNSTDYNNRQIQSFDIEVSPDNSAWSSVAAAALPNNNINVTDQRTNSVPLVASSVQYVRFSNFASWGGGEAGLCEVRFENVEAPPIPEPAGLGLVGLALLAVRRRRS